MSRRSTVPPANEVEAPTRCPSSSDQAVLQLTDQLATALRVNPTDQTSLPNSGLNALRLILESRRFSIGSDAVPAATTMAVRKPSVFFCRIHQESHPVGVAVRIKGCAHRFCRDGLKEYIGSKLKDKQVPGSCPTCITVARDPAESKLLGSASNVPAAFHLITEFLTTGITHDQAEEIGIDSTDFQLWSDLEMENLCVKVECPMHVLSSDFQNTAS